MCIFLRERNPARVAVTKEAIVYRIFTEFVMSHKFPLHHFILPLNWI